jgi:hypothetical protein
MEIENQINKILPKALEFANIEYNVGASEEGSNNAGPYVRKYLNELVEPPANWCSAFVCWCIKEACQALSISMPFEYTLSARKLFNIFKANDWILEKNVAPIPGDLIFFWRDNPLSWMGHIGFVKCIYEEENTPLNYKTIIKTIEGNKGYFPSKVNVYKYDYHTVPCLLGYGRIK